jgi:putative flippase GtrA
MSVPLTFQVIRYYSVGAFAVVVDVSLYQVLMQAHAAPPVAAAISGPVAAALHFALNRTWSFSAFHRPAAAQIPAYLFVYAWVWSITVLVVSYTTYDLHLAPLAAKAAAIGITLPIGFIGHKYLTYGTGLREAARMLSSRFAAWRKTNKALASGVVAADIVSFVSTVPIARYSLRIAADRNAEAGTIALLLAANFALLCFLIAAMLMNAKLLARVASKAGLRIARRTDS